MIRWEVQASQKPAKEIGWDKKIRIMIIIYRTREKELGWGRQRGNV